MKRAAKHLLLIALLMAACNLLPSAQPTDAPAITAAAISRSSPAFIVTATPTPTREIIFVVTATFSPVPPEVAATRTADARIAATQTQNAAYTATAQHIASATVAARITAQQATQNAAATYQAAQTKMAQEYLLPADGRRVFGPVDGVLFHDPNNGFVEIHRAENTNLRDMLIQARFHAPYSDRYWSYGFFFRETHDLEYRLIISSEKEFALVLYEDGQFEQIVSDRLPSQIDLSASAANLVQLAVQGTKADLFVNGEYVASLDVSQHQGHGQVLIGTGFYENSESLGAVTRYEQFTVWSLETATPTPTITFTATRRPTSIPTARPTLTPVPQRGAGRLCPNSPPPRLAIGDIGYVVYGYGPSNLNKYPRRSGNNNIVVDILQEGDTFRVVGGPQCGDGLTWWQVRYAQNNFLGWLAEGEGGIYWLDKY